MSEQEQQQAAGQAPQQQQPAAINLHTLLQTLSTHLISLSSVVQAQSVSAIVLRFDGTPTKFKAWIKAISKNGMLTACDDEKL